MSGFETRFRAEDDADRIRAAFYGFVGAHEADVDGDAHISTEIDTQGPKLRVRLWSAEAMDAFLHSLYAAGRPDRRACYE
jgi:hypothetical protein